MSEAQSISSHQQGGVLILTVQLTKVNQYEVAQAMKHELMAAVKEHSADKVVVDLGKVVFMSSVGYLPYVGLRSYVKDGGGRLVLCKLSDVIKEMFDAARLLVNPRSPKAPFEFADSLEAAIQMLGGDVG